MTEPRRPLEGWGAGARERVWWKRGYDPIGRHTMVAVVLGIAMAALIGATLDPFNLRTSDDLRRAEQTEYDLAYSAVEDEAYTAGFPYGETQHIGERIVNDRQGAETRYGKQFDIGWIEGWNDALAALREAAEADGLPANYTEFRVLEEMQQR